MLLLIAMVSFGMLACKKESNEVSKKAKTYIEEVNVTGYHTSDTFNLSYDADGRLVAMEGKNGKFLYQYATGRVTTDIYNGNQLSIHTVAFLGSNNYIDSTFQYNDTNDSSTEKYTYNSANQLMQIRRYDYSVATGTTFYEKTLLNYDNNGNVISEVTTGSNGAVKNAVNTTYTSTPAQYPIPVPYLPVQYNNLPQTRNDSQGGQTFTFTYDFDSQGRIVSETGTSNLSGTVVKRYGY